MCEPGQDGFLRVRELAISEHGLHPFKTFGVGEGLC
jgi:hypothetical protein